MNAAQPPAAGRTLVLMAGLPGSGKSTFARALAARTGAIILESDALRSLLFVAPVHSSRENASLFAAIRSAGAHLLAAGHGVIIDSTNLSNSDRAPFYALAENAGLSPQIVALHAPLRTIEERLTKRLREPGGYAYADLAVYHRMRGRVEPIAREHFSVDTSDQTAVEAALAAVVAACGEEAGKGRTAVE